MRVLRIMRILASILLLAFLLLAPGPLRRALRRDPMRELFETEDPDWYGVIEIWHIAGFRTYQGSVTNFLQDCCDAFSRTHPGVHFEVSGLTPAMYEDRIRRGLSPDAYSFPAGYLEEGLFRPLSADAPILLDGLGSAEEPGTRAAVPYLMSGYFLLLHTQDLTAEGSTLPDTADITHMTALHEQGQLSFPASIGAMLGLWGEPRSYTEFLQGDCIAAIADARSLGDLLRDTEPNLSVTVLPIGGFSDQVMYLGTAADTDDRRTAYLDEFYADLLSESTQQKLTSLGAMPVRKYLKIPVYGTSALEEWYRAQLDGIQTVDPFRR